MSNNIIHRFTTQDTSPLIALGHVVDICTNVTPGHADSENFAAEHANIRAEVINEKDPKTDVKFTLYSCADDNRIHAVYYDSNNHDAENTAHEHAQTQNERFVTAKNSKNPEAFEQGEGGVTATDYTQQPFVGRIESTPIPEF